MQKHSQNLRSHVRARLYRYHGFAIFKKRRPRNVQFVRKAREKIWYPFVYPESETFWKYLGWHRTSLNKNKQFLKALAGPYGLTVLKMHRLQLKKENEKNAMED